MDDLAREDFCDILSDTSSTGFDDKISPQSCVQLNEIYISDPDFQYIDSIPINEGYVDSSITYLCEICRKNIIKIGENPDSTRKKRKRTENQFIIATMKVCDDCRNMNLEDLKKVSGVTSCKRVVKREHAKKRIQKAETLNNIKDLQEKQIDENEELNENEKKKIKQVIRNRISAQQSRDRKKE